MSLRKPVPFKEKQAAVYGDPELSLVLVNVCYAYREALKAIDREWSLKSLRRSGLPPELSGKPDRFLPITDGRRNIDIKSSPRWAIMEDAVAELVYENQRTKITEAMVRRRVEDRLISALRKAPEWEYHRLTPKEKAYRERHGEDPKERVTRRKLADPSDEPRIWDRTEPKWKDPTGDFVVGSIYREQSDKRLLPRDEWNVWKAHYLTRFTLAELRARAPRLSPKGVGKLKLLASDGLFPGSPLAAVFAFHDGRYTEAQVRELLAWAQEIVGDAPEKLVSLDAGMGSEYGNDEAQPSEDVLP